MRRMLSRPLRLVLFALPVLLAFALDDEKAAHERAQRFVTTRASKVTLPLPEDRATASRSRSSAIAPAARARASRCCATPCAT
jgi:fructoselysine-6-P-deglycase FrlB-like protein